VATPENMSYSDIAAWWGAVVASIVFIWDVYKWMVQGPRLTVQVSPNMKVWGDPRREGKTWISVTVANIGDRATTIKGIGTEYYTSWFSRLSHRATSEGVFPNPNDNFPLPRVLNPGEEWTGLVPQHRLDKGIDFEEMSRSGHLIIWLSQSHKTRPVRRRLIIKQKAEKGSE